MPGSAAAAAGCCCWSECSGCLAGPVVELGMSSVVFSLERVVEDWGAEIEPRPRAGPGGAGGSELLACVACRPW